MKASLFDLPSIGSRAEIEHGMAGMLPELYQRMLRELSEQILAMNSATIPSASPIIISTSKASRSPKPGAARPLFRDADQAHPGRPTRHRAAGGKPDPGGRGHRDARPHDRRTRRRRVRPRLPAALGRRHGAAFARNQVPCRTSMTRSTPQIASPSKRISGYQVAWTEEMLAFDGKYWKIPPGATPWTLETTDKYGKGVEGGILSRSAWYRNHCRNPTRLCFCLSPLPKTRSAGAQRRMTAILPSNVRSTKTSSTTSMPRFGPPQGRGTEFCATSSSPIPMRRRCRMARFRRVRRPCLVRAVRFPPRTARSADGRIPATPEEIVATGYAYVGSRKTTVLRAMEAS